MHATLKSSVWLTALHRRTMLTSTDNVDSNRMFKKHNPRRMMMNGLSVATVPSAAVPPTDARRRLTKSLMNDVAGAVAPGAWHPNSVAVCCAFIFAGAEIQNGNDISNTPPTPTTPTTPTPHGCFEAQFSFTRHFNDVK